jgi:hypothetical protein
MFDFSEKSIFASVLSCSHSLCGARSKSLHFESTGELCSVPCAQSLAHPSGCSLPLPVSVRGSARILAG